MKMLYLILGKAKKSGKSEQVIKKGYQKVRKKQERNKKTKVLKDPRVFLAQLRTKNIYHMFQAGNDSSLFLSRDLTQLLIWCKRWPSDKKEGILLECVGGKMFICNWFWRSSFCEINGVEPSFCFFCCVMTNWSAWGCSACDIRSIHKNQLFHVRDCPKITYFVKNR